MCNDAFRAIPAGPNRRGAACRLLPRESQENWVRAPPLERQLLLHAPATVVNDPLVITFTPPVERKSLGGVAPSPLVTDESEGVNADCVLMML